MLRHHVCLVCHKEYECIDLKCLIEDNQVGGFCGMNCWNKWLEGEKERQGQFAH
jgi:hypothetical protein